MFNSTYFTINNEMDIQIYIVVIVTNSSNNITNSSNNTTIDTTQPNLFV